MIARHVEAGSGAAEQHLRLVERPDEGAHRLGRVAEPVEHVGKEGGVELRDDSLAAG
jgi:hypothetical protein